MAVNYSLFEVFGIETEYMIVGRDDLNVSPMVDQVLCELGGTFLAEVELGPIAISNELANHVIEFKTNGPVSSLSGLDEAFAKEVRHVNKFLRSRNAMLMPTGMHPLMNPLYDTELWEHEGRSIYREFNRIFGCKTHGWVNVQSVHLNLPFADDEEFSRLHAAVRLVLPLIPALAASSPFTQGKNGAWMDRRIDFYRSHAQQVPSVAGRVIPETVFSRDEYCRVIMEPMYRDLATLDPDGVLCHEWANARGAIARFDRNAIEIRLIDAQECPAADIGVCYFLSELLRALVEQELSSHVEQREFPGDSLERLLVLTALDAEQSIIEDRAYLALLGVGHSSRMSAAELFRHLAERLSLLSQGAEENSMGALQVIIDKGPLARRIIRRTGSEPDISQIKQTYRELCACLEENTSFIA